jgi:hypothetical protein
MNATVVEDCYRDRRRKESFLVGDIWNFDMKVGVESVCWDRVVKSAYDMFVSFCLEDFIFVT